MPELAESKFRVPLEPPDHVTACAIPYAELAVTTNFTFLRGASHPDEMVYQAACLGYRAIGITDRNTLAGVVRAHVAAKYCGLKLLIGARLEFNDGPELLVWATDRKAYANLSKLLTLGRRRAPKGECYLSIHDLVDHHEGLLAAVWTDRTTQLTGVENFKDIFGQRLSIALAAPYGCDDLSHLERIAKISGRMGVPLLACNDVHYHDANRRPLQDLLTCVRHKCTIQEAGFRLFPNGERYLKSPEQMQRIFSAYPQAIARGIEIAEQCHFSLDELKYEYPDEVAPAGKTPITYLSELTWEGANNKYPAGIPQKVSQQIRNELELIEQLKFEAYFLTVYDLVKFARGRGILCQGRGSAANSAVCYCIGVTSVDPTKVDLLFERFISAARNEPPDIDVDFEHERREEVIQYVYDKYGRDRAGMTGVLITYRGKSAVRDVGKAMGLGLDLVDHLAKQLDWWHRGGLTDQQLRDAGLDPADRMIHQVIDLTSELLGFPRHLSQHTGGMVMTRGLLCELVPIENASMADRTVIEWDKDDIDALGLLKVDCLALGMLTCISKAFKFLNGENHEGAKAQRREGGGEGNCKVQIAKCKLGIEEDSGATDTAGTAVVRGSDLDVPRASRPCERSSDDDGFRNSKSPSPLRSLGVPGEGESRSESPSRLHAFAPSWPKLELHTIPAEDPVVYDMISAGDTVGVFQIESRAQMAMLPRLQPRNFYDLVIEVAIVRPGPIQGDMVHPYLRRRQGLEAVSFPSEALRQVLGKTLGVPLFQEQAMKIAMVAAGFTGAEADQLRRAMAAWRKSERLEMFHDKIVRGMLKNGYTPEFAEQCFNQIKGFGEYGFPESHSASFALLVYVSAWLKCHHPAAFCAAILNSQPMGFYAPAQLVRDAKNHGVEVHSVDVNHSEWDCTLEEISHEGAKARRREEEEKEPQMNTDEHRWEGEGTQINADERGWEDRERRAGSPCHERDMEESIDKNQKQNKTRSTNSHLCSSVFICGSNSSVRLGFRQLRGFRSDEAEKIVGARRDREFKSIEDLWRRSGISVSAMRQLAEADAFSSLGLSRRQALWEVLRLKDEEVPLYDETDSSERQMMLPLMPIGQEVRLDYVTAGLSLKAHPVALLREELNKLGAVAATELARQPDGKWVKVAGVVLIRQRPGTASGIVFETLEDETGIANLIIKPSIYDHFRPAARHATLLLAEGRVQTDGKVVHLLAYRLTDLTQMLNGLWSKSRDFH